MISGGSVSDKHSTKITRFKDLQKLQRIEGDRRVSQRRKQGRWAKEKLQEL